MHNIASETMRPPVNRAMRVLDRSFFRKTVPISAARISSNQHISDCKKELERSKDTLQVGMNVPLVATDPSSELAAAGRKCILLRESLRPNDTSTWGDTVHRLVDSQRVTIIPYDLNLQYNNWDYNQIITSILPPDLEDIPSGFSVVGHVAHLNLREEYLQYKHLIAQVILDKNPAVKTVINKVDNVGSESEYRTFQYEVLAGPNDLDVIVWEEGCEFHFNYAKVYWNSRLQTEHRRIVELFKEGEAVCDVMAGIGPFAVPAGKKRVFVWANDLNPESFACLKDAIKRNSVSKFVLAFNRDGHQFIKEAAQGLWKTQHFVNITKKVKRDPSPTMRQPSSSDSTSSPQKHAVITRTLDQPRTFSHFVMNLPAIATTFLPSFVGLYSAIPGLPADTQLPYIHVYCFSTKSDDNVAESRKICDELSARLRFDFKPGPAGDLEKLKEGEVWIHDVRDVAPNKRMFCASFRLPGKVAWS